MPPKPLLAVEKDSPSQSVTTPVLLKVEPIEIVCCWVFWRDLMTTFQFIIGMVFCLVALGARAYLALRSDGTEKAGRSTSFIRKLARSVRRERH